MPYIKVIPEEEATGELADYYERIKEQRNQVRLAGTPMELASLNPKAMWHAAELMWHIMRGPSRLTTQQREMIAVVTSQAFYCRY